MTAGSPRLAQRVQLKDKHIITRMMEIASDLDDVIKLGRGDPDLSLRNTLFERVRRHWEGVLRITRTR